MLLCLGPICMLNSLQTKYYIYRVRRVITAGYFPANKVQIGQIRTSYPANPTLIYSDTYFLINQLFQKLHGNLLQTMVLSFRLRYALRVNSYLVEISICTQTPH